jgi:hypothetical protein
MTTAQGIRADPFSESAMIQPERKHRHPAFAESQRDAVMSDGGLRRHFFSPLPVQHHRPMYGIRSPDQAFGNTVLTAHRALASPFSRLAISIT